MPGVPANPAIFHITHVENLAGIVREGGLWSDAERIARGLATTNVGYTHIKARRLKRNVPVAAKGKLGDYVPFYFCTRSIMLYVIHQGHEDYSEGQDAVVHLVSNVQRAVASNRPWAFTDRHAELLYTEYFDDLSELARIDWGVMPLQYWAGSDETKERRQAEFLVHRFFPWAYIECIGVRTDSLAAKVREALGAKGPPVEVRPGWYY